LAHEGVLGVGDRPSAFSLPAYPVLLASAYSMVGHRPGAARWIQVVLGTLTVVFLGRLARRLGGEWAEIIAVAGGALYPYFLYFVREILTETLFLFAFAGMMLTAVRVGERGAKRDGLLHGAFAALGLMTRPVGLALELGVLILARPWAREGRRGRGGGGGGSTVTGGYSGSRCFWTPTVVSRFMWASSFPAASRPRRYSGGWDMIMPTSSTPVCPEGPGGSWRRIGGPGTPPAG
jgi:hypothetical protein